MKKLYVAPLSKEQEGELEELYRKTEVPRVRTRAQMVLLSAGSMVDLSSPYYSNPTAITVERAEAVDEKWHCGPKSVMR